MSIKHVYQPVETLVNGQKQCVSVVRTAAFGPKINIMDTLTVALREKRETNVE